MKKEITFTNKIDLGENCKVIDVKNSIENGVLITKLSYLDNIFIPKNGDIAVFGYDNDNGKCFWVSIVKECNMKIFNDKSNKCGTFEYEILSDDYASMYIVAEGRQQYGLDLNEIEFDTYSETAQIVRTPTECEINKFMHVLEKKYNKIWNAIDKKIENYENLCSSVDIPPSK